MTTQPPTTEHRRLWDEWLSGRPDDVRSVAERFPPWKIFRVKSSGKVCFVKSFEETTPLTVTINITAHLNVIPLDYDVFGVDPDDLEEYET